MKPILTDELLRLLQKISEHYQPPKVKCKRGRQPHFSDLSFLLLAVVAVVTRTFADAELFRLLQTDQKLSATCGFARVPHRTTILRRLKSLTFQAEQQIFHLGAEILIKVPINQSQTVSAIDARRVSGNRSEVAQKASKTTSDSASVEKCGHRKSMVQK